MKSEMLTWKKNKSLITVHSLYQGEEMKPYTY